MFGVSSGRELLDLNLFQPRALQDVLLGDVVICKSFLVLLDQHLISHFGAFILDLLYLQPVLFNFLSVLNLLQKISLNILNLLCLFVIKNSWFGVFWTEMGFYHFLSILQVGVVLLLSLHHLKIQLLVYLLALSRFSQSVELILKRKCVNGSLHLLT
jgi:hypothetical protein